MVDVRVDQGGVHALLVVTPETRVDQAGIQALLNVTPGIRLAQGGVHALVDIQPATPVAQAGIHVLASGIPCTTRLAQIWTITRTDGEVFRLTSLDRDLEYPPGSELIYRACDSLVPSASEAVSEVDAAGNMDLSGAIGVGAGKITEHDLYAGLFDGAEVEAWLVAWGGTIIPKRLLKGTFGAVEQSDTAFKTEVVGDGAKLQQTPLVHSLQPGCRWLFGDPVTCGKDLAPLTVTGTVDSGIGLREFTDAARAETAGYFRRGRVTFTTGDNSGVSAEIKEHATGGVFSLWPRLPFAISTGDEYSMTPGCTNIKASADGCNGCTAWDNLERYGGFDKVPGGDKRSNVAVQRPPG